MLFTKGKEVTYNGRQYIVDHVTLSNMQMYVYLDGIPKGILDSEIYCDLTELKFNKVQ